MLRYNKMSIFLYVAIIVDPQFKLYDMVYGLTLSHGRKSTYLIASKTKKALNALFLEYSTTRGGNILVSTPTAQPQLKVRMGGKRVRRDGLREWRSTTMPTFYWRPSQN